MTKTILAVATAALLASSAAYAADVYQPEPQPVYVDAPEVAVAEGIGHRERNLRLGLDDARRVFVRIGYSSNPSECCPSTPRQDPLRLGTRWPPCYHDRRPSYIRCALIERIGQLTTGCRGAGC